MKLDILAFAAHPDDVELSCSGTIIKHVKAGKKVGIIDLTRGELGTRGTAAIRDEEAKRASEILGITIRENLNMADGFFDFSRENKIKVIEMIRKFKPEVVLANAIYDRHPDHGKAASLVSEACFLSGLTKVQTHLEGKEQQAWRPKAVYHYIQDRRMKPDFIVDISDFMEHRLNAIKAFSSQFYNPESNEPVTEISTKQFMELLTARALEFGRQAGFEYGEGYTVERPVGLNYLTDIK